MIYLFNNFILFALKYIIMLALITGGVVLGGKLAQRKQKTSTKKSEVIL